MTCSLNQRGRLKGSVIFTINQVEMIFKAVEFVCFSQSQEFLNAFYVKKFLSIFYPTLHDLIG
jgi:hypothetical protein